MHENPLFIDQFLTYMFSRSIVLYHCDYTGREKPKTFFKDI